MKKKIEILLSQIKIMERKMPREISKFLTQDHRACDEAFSEVENSILNKKTDGLDKKFQEFADDFLNHFKMEEEVMFPVFEERTGMFEGPTQVMRMEHQQMKGLIAQMQGDVEKGNYEHFLGLAETFMILTQQHNAKEEQMLYNMADQVLGDVESEVIEKMKNI